MHWNYPVRVLDLRLNKPNTWGQIRHDLFIFWSKKAPHVILWLVGTCVKYESELNLDQDVPNQTWMYGILCYEPRVHHMYGVSTVWIVSTVRAAESETYKPWIFGVCQSRIFRRLSQSCVCYFLSMYLYSGIEDVRSSTCETSRPRWVPRARDANVREQIVSPTSSSLGLTCTNISVLEFSPVYIKV